VPGSTALDLAAAMNLSDRSAKTLHLNQVDESYPGPTVSGRRR